MTEQPMWRCDCCGEWVAEGGACSYGTRREQYPEGARPIMVFPEETAGPCWQCEAGYTHPPHP